MGNIAWPTGRSNPSSPSSSPCPGRAQVHVASRPRPHCLSPQVGTRPPDSISPAAETTGGLASLQPELRAGVSRPRASALGPFPAWASSLPLTAQHHGQAGPNVLGAPRPRQGSEATHSLPGRGGPPAPAGDSCAENTVGWGLRSQDRGFCPALLRRLRLHEGPVGAVDPSSP